MSDFPRGWRWAVYLTVTLLLAASAALHADDSPSVLLTLSTDRYAVCAGGVHNDIHQAHLLATVTDLSGQPLAGQLVYFSADHKVFHVAPSFDPPVAITDAQGEARTVLTSGDCVTSGQVTARCGGAEGAVPMSFECPEGHMDILDASTGLPVTRDPADGKSKELCVVHETWRGMPVPGHHLTWWLSAWYGTAPHAREEDKTADYRGAGEPPFGSISPIDRVSDERGITAAIKTSGTVVCIINVHAADMSVQLP